MDARTPAERKIARRTFVGVATAATVACVAGCKRQTSPHKPASSSAVVPDLPVIPVVIDTRSIVGPFNRLSGVQGSPHPIVVDDSDHRVGFREVAIEHARFPQDCYPNTLTLAAIFPNERADPERAESYRFAALDKHMEAARASGTEVLWQASYDVGRSDRWMGMNLGGRAPTDWVRWSRVLTRCLEHFNNGWAGGSDYAVKAVEFPNEPPGLGGFGGKRLPDLIPALVTFLQVVERYNHSHPTTWVKAVGPGIPFSFADWEALKPRFKKLFTTLRKQGVALPAFSFHTYGDDVSPAANAHLATSLRGLLDEHGMKGTELWNTEWQAGEFVRKHLAVDKRRVANATAFERQQFGAAMAAYALSCKARWQGVVDRAYYYRANMRAFPPAFQHRAADLSGWMGLLFVGKGQLRPLALQERLTAELMGHTPQRCSLTTPGDDAFTALALRSEDPGQLAVLLCNLHERPRSVSVRFDGVAGGAYAARTLSIDASSPGALVRRDLRAAALAAEGVGVDLVVPGLASVGVALSK